MFRINANYLKLKAGYLFPEIARRVNLFAEAHPDAKLIRCGIGDVTEPLPEAVRQAMHQAIDEMGTQEGFRGYGPEQGYDFIRKTIAENEYRSKGVEIADDEIFLSDGSKCDSGHILEVLGNDNRIAVMDPVYPVYVDTNVMAGHTGPADENGVYEGLTYLRCGPENEFVPALPDQPVDLVYLCYPNNPTGTVATREQLTRWVEYALEHGALILFDAAYEAFIQDPEIPHSIFEIPGAEKCAVEFRSFSKHGGFTGVRCAYTVMSKELEGQTPDGEKVKLHPLWNRRWSTRFNGVSYPVQRGAEALYSEEGKRQTAGLIEYYMGNARVLREGAQSVGFTVYGGTNAPYIWVETPKGSSSWDMFDRFLQELHVVVTPGSGFGAAGEGFFRISAFNSRENAEEVARRMKDLKL